MQILTGVGASGNGFHTAGDGKRVKRMNRTKPPKRITSPLRRVFDLICHDFQKSQAKGVPFAYAPEGKLGARMRPQLGEQQISRHVLKLEALGALGVREPRFDAKLQREIERFTEEGLIGRYSGHWGNVYVPLCEPDDLDYLVGAEKPSPERSRPGGKRRGKRCKRRRDQPVLFDGDVNKIDPPCRADDDPPYRADDDPPCRARAPLDVIIKHQRHADAGDVGQKKKAEEALSEAGISQRWARLYAERDAGLALVAVAYWRTRKNVGEGLLVDYLKDPAGYGFTKVAGVWHAPPSAAPRATNGTVHKSTAQILEEARSQGYTKSDF